MKQKAVFLDTFEGHLVLICKRHYVGQNNFFGVLRRFWEVRCGVPQGSFDSDSVFENIADSMYKIIRKCQPEKLDYFYQVIHRELVKDWAKPEDMNHIQALVWEYHSVLQFLQIKEKVGNKWATLVSLPKPQKQLLKRVCNGNGRYEDYDKLVKKDTRVEEESPPKYELRLVTIDEDNDLSSAPITDGLVSIPDNIYAFSIYANLKGGRQQIFIDLMVNEKEDAQKVLVQARGVLEIVNR